MRVDLAFHPFSVHPGFDGSPAPPFRPSRSPRIRRGLGLPCARGSERGVPILRAVRWGSHSVHSTCSESPQASFGRKQSPDPMFQALLPGAPSVASCESEVRSQKSDPGPSRRKASVTALGTSRRGPLIPPSPDPRRSGGPSRRHAPCGCPRGRCRWRGWRLRWTVPGSFGPAPGQGR